MNKKRLAALAMAGLMAAQLTTMAFAEDVTDPVFANGVGQQKIVEGNVTVEENSRVVVANKEGSVKVTGDVTGSITGDSPLTAVIANLENSKAEVGGNVTAEASVDATGVRASNKGEITVGGNVTTIVTAEDAQDGKAEAIGVRSISHGTVTVGGDVTVTAESGVVSIGVNTSDGASVTVTGDVNAEEGVGIYAGLDQKLDTAVPDLSGTTIHVEGDVNAGLIGIDIIGCDNTVVVDGDVNADSYGVCTAQRSESQGSDASKDANYVEIGGSVISAKDGISLKSDSEVVVMGSVIAEESGIYVSGKADGSLIVVAGDVTTTSETGVAVNMFAGNALIGGDATGRVEIGGKDNVSVAVGGTIDGDLEAYMYSSVYANNVTGDVILGGTLQDIKEVVLGERKDIYVKTTKTPSLADYENVKGVVKYLLDLGADKGNVNVETEVSDYITKIVALNHDEADEAQRTVIDKIVEQNGVLADNNGTVTGIYLNDDTEAELAITVSAKAGAELKGLAVIDNETGEVTPLTMEDGVYIIRPYMVDDLISGALTLNVDCKLIPNEDGTYRVVKAEKTQTTQETEQKAQALAITNEIEDGAFVIPEAVAGEAVELAIPKTGAASAEEVLEVTLKKVE